MQKASNSDFLDVINGIYSAKNDNNINQMRYNILKTISPFFDAIGATFFLSSNKKNLDVSSGISYNLHQSYSSLYQDYFHKIEPFRSVIDSNIICATNDFIYKEKDWENLEYYNEFLKPQKIHNELIICIRSENQFHAKIGVFRQKDAPKFNSEELRYASTIAKILELLLENISIKKECENVRNFYKGLEHFPNLSILVLDFNLNPIYFNEYSRNLCLKIQKDREHAERFGENRNIPIPSEVIQDCLKLKNDFLKNGENSALTLTSAIYPRRFRRYVSKVYLNFHPVNSMDSPSFIVLLEDFTEIQQGREETARAEFGLTEREIEICRGISEGYTNDELANKLFLSRFTIQTHIMHIFEKTNVKNRRELINLIESTRWHFTN